MDECIKRENCRKSGDGCEMVDGYDGAMAMEIVASPPAADVAPVVRCEGCEHAERYERADGTAGYYCGHPQNTFTYGEHWGRVFKPAKEADDYCSYGERKDGGADNG